MYKDISLPAILYKRETCFMSIEKDRSRMFENGVLKRICGYRMEEVTGGWTKLYAEKPNDVDSLSVISLVSKEVCRWQDM
jgi:hypothetical protein